VGKYCESAQRTWITSRVYQFLRRVVRGIQAARSPFLERYPPGHYYSPIPDMSLVLDRKDSDLKQKSKECLGLDLREEKQLNLLEELSSFYSELPFSVQPSDSRRYYYDNSHFSFADAIVLFGMLRHFEPHRIIEVGSGFSSALMLDTDDIFLHSSTQFTFIDPFPSRLNDMVTEKDKDRCTIITKLLQDVDLNIFDSLGKNDILLVDSSHVVKAESDVGRIFFEVLPRLKLGVIVHFHDICWPFDYPKHWFLAGRAWNEAYFLRAFLQYNKSFEILYFNSFMNLFHQKKLKETMPLSSSRSSYALTEAASSLWLKRADEI